ncbi:Rieske (2Fe-2S) protein, partial [Methanomethylovorans sp. PtaU1.Bin093]
MEDNLAEEKMKVVNIEGKQVLFIKKEGTVYAIDNKCPHMGCPLKGGI